MKISYQLLRQFIPDTPSPEHVAEILTRTGLEVEGIETIEKIPGGLKGVVVGHVLACEKHPDADRLSITQVDLGSEQPVQIVCGAPNVAAGQKVLVATVGSTLYPSTGEPFAIKKSKIRGAESHGMICAEDELGLGQSHDGILILPAETQVGTPAAEALNIESDQLLEIGITPNRTDALSHVGVARDFIAAWNVEHPEAQKTLLLPSFHTLPTQSNGWSIQLENETACARYACLEISGLANQPTPDWMKEILVVIGVKPINLAVDLTNYIQYELGQPMHVFRAADFESKTIHIRNGKDETMKTLDGIERKITETDVVIASDRSPLCIAGVMGSLDAGVQFNDDHLIFESACFNAVRVRKTAKKFGIHSDSSFRFERGTGVDAVPTAMKRLAQLVSEIAPEAQIGGYAEVYPEPILKAEITLTAAYLQQLTGIQIPAAEVSQILQHLDFEVEAIDDVWKIKAPYNRVEVTRPADVVEEILRIYGYDKIEVPSRMKLSLNSKGKTENLYYQVAQLLAAQGFSEIMSMSLVKSTYAESFDTLFQVESVSLKNPLSKDLSHMRSSLIFGGLESIALNEKHRANNLRLFEIGKEYRKTENGYAEKRKLAIWMVGDQNPESWNRTAEKNTLIQLRSKVEMVLNALGVKQLEWNELEEKGAFAYGLEAVSQKKVWGVCGQVRQELLDACDVQQDVFYAEFEFNTLEKAASQQKNNFEPLTKYPWVRRDLSLLVNKPTSFETLRKTAFKAERKLLKDVSLFDVYEGKNLPEGKKSYALKFILQDEQQTLTDEAVEKSMQRILQGLQTECSAELR